MGYRSIYTELYTKMLCNVRDVPVFSHTDYIMQTARWAIKTYVPSLLIKMLCNVRDVPVFFICRLHHANSQMGYCQIYVQRLYT